MTLRVERAVPADAPGLLALHRRVLDEGEWFLTEPDELAEGLDAKIAAIRESARSGSALLLVARADHVLVGYVHVVAGTRRRLRHVARVEVMVDVAWRGRGVGDQLVGSVVQWAEQTRVIRKLSLNVFLHNTAAIALYRKHGFVDEGRREREYLFPDGTYRGDLLMARWLG